MWHNKYVFGDGPSSWHRAPKTLVTPSDRGERNIFHDIWSQCPIPDSGVLKPLAFPDGVRRVSAVSHNKPLSAPGSLC